jgi:hypothetical protein
MKTRLYNKSIAGLIFNALNTSPMIESCTCPPSNYLGDFKLSREVEKGLLRGVAFVRSELQAEYTKGAERFLSENGMTPEAAHGKI